MSTKSLKIARPRSSAKRVKRTNRAKRSKRTKRANTPSTKRTKKHKRSKRKRSKRTKKLVKLQCGPDGNTRKYTCIRDQSICKLKSLWNKRHPDDAIKSTTIRKTWGRLKSKLSTVCNKESCWMKQNFSEGKFKNELGTVFAPSSPPIWKKNPHEWLSSSDITAVMKQYEKKYKCFNFIGPSPIDYDSHKMYGECVWEELCHFNLKNEIAAGKRKFGIIFNLDPHTKGGSHWVSLYINVNKRSIFYFDSVGKTAPAQIKKFMNTVKRQGAQMEDPVDFTIDENHPIEHQFGDTECGIYSLYFIIHLLEDKHDEEYFKTHTITDKCVARFRKIYFNQSI